MSSPEKQSKRTAMKRSQSIGAGVRNNTENSRDEKSAGKSSSNPMEQSVPIALKNLTSTMKRFSHAMALPYKQNGLPAMPAKFVSSFHNTMLDLAPRSVIVKYLDQLEQMSRKGTRYNEPVVLSRLIPKYLREMEATGRPEPLVRDRRNLLTEIRNFNEWSQYLIGRTLEN